MKKIIFISSLLILIITFNAYTQTSLSPTMAAEKNDHKWRKDPDGAWKGQKEDKTYWYKLDDKKRVTWSEDGKKFENAGNGMWADKAGRLLMVSDGRLVWTLDEGKTWVNAPDWKWQGSDGKWYKFDKDWTLWVADK